jgi:5-methylcytosine-specific restriction endonuclease McrA
LPPSIRHRVETVTTWVRRFSRLAPISSILGELNSFRSQELQVESAIQKNREKKQTKSELRRLVYTKWGRKCIYCDTQGAPLELDHIVARSEGGSDRAFNRVPACQSCNLKKGTLSLQRFLAKKPELLQYILGRMKESMRDAAALYGMRRGLRETLTSMLVPLHATSIDVREANRERLGIPWSPALNAACSGSAGTLIGWNQPILRIQCRGRGSYQRTGSYIPGRPKGDHRNRQIFSRDKVVQGFQTGDIVKAVVKRGKNPGVYRGRAAVRASGDIDVSEGKMKIRTVSTNCRLIQRSDGYEYSVITPPQKP